MRAADLSVAVVALLVPAIAYADDALPIVEVIGNTRTDREVILAAAELVPGHVDAATLADARQRVLNLRLFSSVELTPRSDGSIEIRVTERWTLFPVPFISSSGRGTQVGLAVLESNLLGHNKLVAIGGGYATFGSSVFAIYSDPGIAGTRAILRANLSYAKIERQRQVDGDITNEYDDARADGSVLGGYRITNRLSLLAGWFVTRVHARPESGFASVPSTSLIHGWEATVDYRGADFRTYYDEGVTASIQYKQARHELGADRDVLDIVAKARLTHAFGWDQATSLTAKADLVDGDPILDVHLLGGLVGTRGFEQQTLWVDRAATLTLDHQVPVWSWRWMIWTLDGFVDTGYAGLAGHGEWFATPGAGVRLYLPRMAFPALGVDVSYSFQTDSVVAVVAFGASL